MPAVVINQKNYKKEIKRCKIPVLLSFWTKRGFSSLLMLKTADDLSTELSGRIKVGVVSDMNCALVSKYNIRVFPAVLLIKNGAVTQRIVGNLSKESFLKILSES